jgi:hypothetical protein
MNLDKVRAVLRGSVPDCDRCVFRGADHTSPCRGHTLAVRSSAGPGVGWEVYVDRTGRPAPRGSFDPGLVLTGLVRTGACAMRVPTVQAVVMLDRLLTQE